MVACFEFLTTGDFNKFSDKYAIMPSDVVSINVVPTRYDDMSHDVRIIYAVIRINPANKKRMLLDGVLA